MHFNNMVVGIESKEHEVTLELVINARKSSTDNETKQSNEGTTLHVIIFRTNVASVGSVFSNTRKVKVLSLPETIKEKIDVSSEGPSSGVGSVATTNSRRRPSLETSIFPLSFQVVREPLPFAYHFTCYSSPVEQHYPTQPESWKFFGPKSFQYN